MTDHLVVGRTARPRAFHVRSNDSPDLRLGSAAGRAQGFAMRLICVVVVT